MSLLDQRDSVVVGRLRVKGTSVDQLADQRRASRLMRHADLHSRHVPAGGLLCVRTLRDPAPRVQPLGSDRVYLLPAWELAVNGQLDRHATEAARPLLGRVPSSAESVLFLDDAEVLACLAADWLSGTLARNWWWRQVLKSFDCGAVIDTWMRSIAAVPAAMELLHAWDMDERFVAQIPRTHADSLVRKMLRVHGVSSVEGRFSKVLPEAVADSQRTERGRASREPARNREEREPPWSPFVSLKEGTQLSGVGRQLIVQALMLRRAPDVARSSGFQRELSEYLAADALEESRGSQREPGAKWRGEPGGQRRKHSDLGGQKVESSATGNQAEEKRLAATRIEGRQGPSAHDRGDTAVKGERYRPARIPDCGQPESKRRK